MQQDAGNTGTENKNRFGNFLEYEEQKKREEGECDRGAIHHSPFAEDDSRTGDGADGCGRCVLYKGFDLEIFGETAVMRREDHEQVRRQEDRENGGAVA